MTSRADVFPGADLLRAAIDAGSLTILRRLVEGGWSDASALFDEQSALEYAIRRRQNDLAGYLARFVAPSLQRRAFQEATEWLRLCAGGESQVGDLDLYRALETMDHAEVERLLAERDPSTRFNDGSGKPLLIWAVENADEAASVLLLRFGAPVNSTERTSGLTPLMQAARLNRWSLVQILIRAGADPKRADADGWDALMITAQSRNAHAFQIAELLIGAGASVDARTRVGMSAAMIAVLHERSRMADFLLARGVPVAGLSDARLCLAARKGDVAAIEGAIEEGASFEAHDDEGTPAIVLAARSGSVAALRKLIDRGYRVSSRSEEGDTALHAACGAGHLPAIHLLIAAGADAFAETSRGDSPLLCAQASRVGAAVDLIQSRCRDVIQSPPDMGTKMVALRCLVMHGTQQASE